MGYWTRRTKAIWRAHKGNIVVSTLLFMTVVAYACGGTQSAGIVPTPVPEVSSSSATSTTNTANSNYVGNQSQTGAASVSVPPPAISVPAPAVSAPAPAASVPPPAAASRPPTYPFVPPTLDERIFFADVIAIVRPISVEPSVLSLQFTTEQPQYSPFVQSGYEVIEYLKGDGDPEIIVDAKNIFVTYSNVEQALQIAESKAAAQLSELGDRGAVVFLQRMQYNPDSVLDVSRKANETEWRQHNVQTGLFSASQDVGNASTTFNAASGSAAVVGNEAFSIGELRERIEAMESLIREGEGIDGWEYCIRSRFFQENYLRAREFPSVFDVEPFPSGLPAGSIIDEFDTTSPKQWFTGANEHLFHYGANEITTTRPIPSGAYEVQSHFQESEWMPCDYVPPPDTWRYNFESAASTLHEAFFDPVDIGDAIGADGESGVLQPEWFESEEGETVIERIEWSEGQVDTELSPATDLADYRMDFIELDGSVALRLAFDDAVALVDADDVATFAWGVCEQPWADGDLLMLRIAEGIPDDDVAATSDPECLSAAPTPTP